MGLQEYRSPQGQIGAAEVSRVAVLKNKEPDRLSFRVGIRGLSCFFTSVR